YLLATTEHTSENRNSTNGWFNGFDHYKIRICSTNGEVVESVRDVVSYIGRICKIFWYRSHDVLLKGFKGTIRADEIYAFYENPPRVAAGEGTNLQMSDYDASSS